MPSSRWTIASWPMGSICRAEGAVFAGRIGAGPVPAVAEFATADDPVEVIAPSGQRWQPGAGRRVRDSLGRR